MRSLLVLVMLVLAALDAVPARTLFAMGANAPVKVSACSCCGECLCSSCATHHPEAPDPGPGLHAADCGGCATSGGSVVPVPAFAVFDVPPGAALAPDESSFVSRVPFVAVPCGAHARPIDPPPRRAAA